MVDNAALWRYYIDIDRNKVNEGDKMRDYKAVKHCAALLYHAKLSRNVDCINAAMYEAYTALTLDDMNAMGYCYTELCRVNRFNSVMAFVLYCGNMSRSTLKLSLDFFRSRR